MTLYLQRKELQVTPERLQSDQVMNTLRQAKMNMAALYWRRASALTLIELLVVVAVLSVLAGIATLNYLNAQIKAKHARVKADLHSVATAIETYRLDWNHYPFDIVGKDGKSPGANDYWYLPSGLTTPVAYMATNVFLDPFRQDKATLPERYFRPRYVNYSLMPMNLQLKLLSEKSRAAYAKGYAAYGVYRLSASGPDGKAGPWDPTASWTKNGGYTHFPGILVNYDPSNGTRSNGDIVRGQGAPEPTQASYD